MQLKKKKHTPNNQIWRMLTNVNAQPGVIVIICSSNTECVPVRRETVCLVHVCCCWWRWEQIAAGWGSDCFGLTVNEFFWSRFNCEDGMKLNFERDIYIHIQYISSHWEATSDWVIIRERRRHSHIKKALLDFAIGGFTESEKGDKFKNWCLSHVARSSSKDFLWKGN